MVITKTHCHLCDFKLRQSLKGRRNWPPTVQGRPSELGPARLDGQRPHSWTILGLEEELPTSVPGGAPPAPTETPLLPADTKSVPEGGSSCSSRSIKKEDVPGDCLLGFLSMAWREISISLEETLWPSRIPALLDGLGAVSTSD